MKLDLFLNHYLLFKKRLISFFSLVISKCLVKLTALFIPSKVHLLWTPLAIGQ